MDLSGGRASLYGLADVALFAFLEPELAGFA